MLRPRRQYRIVYDLSTARQQPPLNRPKSAPRVFDYLAALIRDGAVRVLSLFRPEEVDYWRDELKSHRRNSREIELMTWAKHAATLRGRAHYGRIDEFAEYVFQFIRTSEGELWKFGAVAFSKAEDRALARQVIDIFGTKN